MAKKKNGKANGQANGKSGFAKRNKNEKNPAIEA